MVAVSTFDNSYLLRQPLKQTPQTVYSEVTVVYALAKFLPGPRPPASWRLAALSLLLALALLVVPAAAQQSELAQLKAASSLSPDDVNVIQQWVQQHLQTLLAAENLAAVIRATRPFTDAYTGATPTFQTGFAEQCTTAFIAPINNPQVLPTAALMMTKILVNQSQPIAISALAQALSSPHVAARFWAAKGLTKLRRELSAGTQANQIIGALEQAAGKETSPVALRQMYAALNLREVSSNMSLAARAGQALVVVLRSQLQRHAGPTIAPGLAEASGLRILGTVTAELDGPTQRQAVEAAAQLLHHATAQATTTSKEPTPHAKRQASLVVEQAELFLRQVLRNAGHTAPAPDVLAKLKAGKNDDAQIELQKWIGSDQQPGLLNPLFGLPPGAGLQPPPKSETGDAEPPAD